METSPYVEFRQESVGIADQSIGIAYKSSESPPKSTETNLRLRLTVDATPGEPRN